MVDHGEGEILGHAEEHCAAQDRLSSSVLVDQVFVLWDLLDI